MCVCITTHAYEVDKIKNCDTREIELKKVKLIYSKAYFHMSISVRACMCVMK